MANKYIPIWNNREWGHLETILFIPIPNKNESVISEQYIQWRYKCAHPQYCEIDVGCSASLQEDVFLQTPLDPLYIYIYISTHL